MAREIIGLPRGAITDTSTSDSIAGLQSQIDLIDTYYNVKQYVDVATALTSVPTDATLVFPNGEYTAPSAAGWTIAKAMHVIAEKSAIIRPYGGDKDSIGLQLTSSNVWIQGLTIGNASQPASTGTGDGILVPDSGTRQYLRLTDLLITNMGRHGIYAWGSGSNYPIDQSDLRGCRFFSNRGCGFKGNQISDANFLGGSFDGNRLQAIHITNGGVVNILGTTMGNSNADETNVAIGAVVYLGNLRAGLVMGNDFEKYDQSSSANARQGLIMESCAGVIVGGNQFTNDAPGTTASTRAIWLNTASKGNVILSNRITYAVTAVRIEPGTTASGNNTGNFVAMQEVAAANATSLATISIPDADEAATNSGGGNFAMIPLTDGNGSYPNYLGAILLPKVSGTAAFGASVLQEGLVCWDNSANSFAVYSGAAWVPK